MNTIYLLLLLILSPFVVAGEIHEIFIQDEKVLGTLKCDQNRYRLSNQSVGLRTIGCNLQSILSIADIETKLGLNIFQSNSKHDPYDFSSTSNFNRYNPEIFVKVNKILIDQESNKITSQIYNKFFKNISRAYYSIGKALSRNPEFNNMYLAMYVEAIESGTEILPGSLYKCKSIGAFVPEHERRHKGSYDRQSLHGSNTVYFWLRRQIDGSFDSLYELIESVIKKYDSEYYTEVNSMNPVITKGCDVEFICPL